MMAHFTTSRTRQEYLSLRSRYEPQLLTLIIIAESPPASGRYFYNPEGAVTEPLFAALMKQLGVSPDTKERGLEAVKRKGWILADATYEPVNNLSSSERDKVILRDYPMLRQDIGELVGNEPTPIILLKVNVCRILEPKLISDEFNVINRRRKIYFPSTGCQNKFHKQFGEILREAAFRNQEHVC